MSAALALAVGALALRLWVLRALPVIDADGVSYVTLARRLADGGSAFDPLFHPLYPAAFAVVAPLAGDWELAARLVSALAGALLVLAAWALTRALLGEDAARLAAILVAVHPALVRAGTAAMPEALYALLLVGGVWAAWRALGAGAEAWLVAAGFLFGLAYLARPEGAAYLLGLVAAVLLATLRDRRRRRLAWGGGAVLAWLLVAAPYLVYLRGVQGRWTLSGKLAHNLSLVQGTAGAPSPLPWRVLENAYLFQKYALPELLPGVVAFLLVPGVVARARRRGWLAQDGVLLAACLPPFAALAFHIEARFFFPVLPFLLPFVAAGAIWAAGVLAPERRAGAVALALTLAVALAALPAALRPVLRPDPGAALYREAARWVAETQPRDAALLERKPFVGFYSGRRSAPLPRVGPEELLDAARRAGARLVVLDSRELPYDRPRLLPLVWAPPPPGLELLRDFDAPPADRLRILLVRERE